MMKSTTQSADIKRDMARSPEMKQQSTQVDMADFDEERQAVDASEKTISDEIRVLWNEYCTSSTIHGIGLTGRPHLYPYRKSIWSLLVLAMASVLGVILYNHTSRLRTYPIKTKVMVKYVEQIDFPTVTICNLNQFRRSRVPNNTVVKSVMYHLSEFAKLKWKASDHIPNHTIPADQDLSGEQMRVIFENAAHRLDELFILCEWKSKRYPCEDLFSPTDTNIGTCYSFNGNKSDIRKAYNTGPFQGLRVVLNTEQNQYYFSSSFKSGVKVVIDETNTTPFPDREGWSFRPGVAASIGLSKEEKTSLPYPYRAFGNKTCLDTDDPSNKNILKRFEEYNLNACLFECFHELLIKVCNCAKYNVPRLLNGTTTRLCSAREIIQCYLPTMNSLDADALRICTCPWKCNTVLFHATISYADISSRFIDSLTDNYNLTPYDNYIRFNAIDLNIFFDTMGITKVYQEPEISVNEILGTLGGQMGLFLGASILSITELTEIFILFLYRSFVKLFGRMKKHVKNITLSRGNIPSNADPNRDKN